MSDLPRGWVETSIKGVCEVILGQSPPGSAYNTGGDGLPFFQGKAEFGSLVPTTKKWTTAGNKVARLGDVLVSVRAPVGPTNLAPFDCVIGRGLAALRPTSATTTRFVLYQLRATERLLASVATGSTFTAISGDQLRNHCFLLPPMAEQDRIVAAIEEHFSGIEEAEMLLRTLRKKSGSLRRALLTDAVNGDWPQKSVGDIASLRDGPFGSNLKTSHYVASGPQVVRLQNIGDGYFRNEKAHITEAHFASLAKHAVHPGDVVVASLGDEVPRACLIPSWLGPAIVKADCIRVRVTPDMDSGFLMWVLNSDPIRTQAATRIKGIGRPRLGLRGIRELVVPVPPLNHQRQVASRLDQWTSLLEVLNVSIDHALTRSELLRRAVLERAFSGQLAPRDPSDEPAAELLARIHSEKHSDSANRRRRRIRA